MKRVVFSLSFFVLLIISCGGTRTVIEQSGEITEGEAKVVKLQQDNSEKSSASTQSAKTAKVPENPSASVNEKLSPEAKKLLEQMKKEQEKSTSTREEKLKELEAELQKSGTSQANLEKADACVTEGNKLFAEKSYEAAAQKYREALDHYPLHKEALTKLTECYRLLDSTESEKETDLAPQEERFLLRQKFAAGEQLLSENKPDEAAAKFREVIDMITWSKKKLDTQNYLERAKEYLEKIESRKKESAQPGNEEGTPQK